jgi:polyisoprenyl-phosphate glycosyltransferase
VNESLPLKIAVCAPVFNDWTSALDLVAKLDDLFAARGWRGTVLLVDDASTAQVPNRLPNATRSLQSVEILRLRRNLGHQRAIAVGLCAIREREDCDAVVVMDADGEDPPDGIGALVERFEHWQRERVIFARRRRRTEGVLFRMLYALYKLLHSLFVGWKIEVGNFSILPYRQLDRVVGASEIWNHYAAAVYKLKLPRDLVPVDRGHRIAGQSQMRLEGLIVHGLSAMSVVAETVGVRLLIGVTALAAVSLLGLAASFVCRGIWGFSALNWLSVLCSMLLLVSLPAGVTLLVFVLQTLRGRDVATFLPLRDYQHLILDRLVLSRHA